MIASICLFFVVFFIVTVKLSEPTVMTLNLPQTDENISHSRLGEHNVITILLGKNSKIIYYGGPLDSPVISPKETKYGENGIRKELIQQNKSMQANSSKLHKSKKLIVIIKPSSKSTYKNLVDILDEMAITNVQNYAIVKDFTPEEEKLLASK
ncbi:ExbD/TolR family protein [Flavobacterium sp. FlaQc-57]|uniref:ExbD/TolR family protein n=1 Tax=Flavobacterium sp. FlaQc-57 TaxID=3374186 RepID=UPI003756E32C